MPDTVTQTGAVIVHNMVTGHTYHYDRSAYDGLDGRRRALIAADRLSRGDGNWWNYPTDDPRITESPRFLTLGDWVTRHPDNTMEVINL